MTPLPHGMTGNAPSSLICCTTFSLVLGDVEVEVANRTAFEGLLDRLSPVISCSRLIPLRLKHRCSDDQVRRGIVTCRHKGNHRAGEACACGER